MDRRRIPGMITNDEMKTRVDEANNRLKYSKRLTVFKPSDIEMLVDLSSIEPEIAEYDDSNLSRGDICQLVVYPSGTVNLGKFNEIGSGKSYYTVTDPQKFTEGVHFKFL